MIKTLVILLTIATSVSAQQPSLQDLVNRAAKTTLDRFADKKLKEEELSITLIDLRDPRRPETASFHGNERIYPASVVKLFYLVATHRWLEDRKIEQTPELTRAVRVAFAALPVTISIIRRAVASVVSLLRFSPFGPRETRSRP